MTNVLYKNVDQTPVFATGGEGVWLVDRDGNRYLDTCGGVAVSSLGHCHPRIVEAMRREAGNLSWAHAGSFTTRPAEELAELLLGSAGGLARVQFLSGGSEAVELGMKIVYQYHWESGNPGKQVFIARRQGYHGSTLTALQVSGNRQRRTIFEPMLGPAEFVSPCYAYRGQRPDETEDDYADRLAAELESKILEIGPENVAAFMAETVVGSTTGAVGPVRGYFRKIAAVCRKYNVLLFLDEVMCGSGRTGFPYSYLEDGIVPDLVAIGKGLAAGYQPISAILISEELSNAMLNGSGVLRNGQTHVNHPFACAVALAVQRTIVDDDLLENVRTRGKQLRALLTERFATHEQVGDIRGRGMFVGVELVTDRETRAPIPDSARLTALMKRDALQRGLLIYPGSGTIDGVAGNHVLFAPPFIATDSDIEAMVDRFADVVEATVTATMPRRHIR